MLAIQAGSRQPIKLKEFLKGTSIMYQISYHQKKTTPVIIANLLAARGFARCAGEHRPAYERSHRRFAAAAVDSTFVGGLRKASFMHKHSVLRCLVTS